MNQTLMQQQSQEEDFNLHEVIGFVLGNRGWLITGLLVGAFIGLIFALTQTPMYKANTTLQFSEAKKAGVGSDQFSAMFDLQQGSNMDAAIPVLQSRTLAEDVVRRLALNAQLENVSDISAVKSVQRRIRRFINPPDSLAYHGWSGKTRYYVAKVFGDPGPVGSMIVRNLSVDNAVSHYPLTLKLLPDDSGLKVLDDDGKLMSSCLVNTPCEVKFPNGKISFEVESISAGYDTTLVMSFQSFQAAASAVMAGVRVNPLNKIAKYLSVDFVWADPYQAAIVLHVLTDAYETRDRKRVTRSYDQMIDFLDKSLAPTQTGLEQAERELRGFLSRHKMLDMKLQYEQGAKNITGFDQQQIDAELESRQLAYLADILSKSDSVNYGALIGNVSGQLAEEWNAATKKSAELELAGKELENFTEEYPAKKKHLMAVAALEQRKDELRKKALQAIRDKQALLSAKTRLLDTASIKVQQGLGLEAETQIEFMRLSRNKEIAEKIYGLMQSKREEMRLAKAGEISSMQVLDSPLPGMQVSPNVGFSTLLGGILGLLALGFVAFLRETLDIAIKDPGDIERLTGLYLHGMIPIHKEAAEQNGLVTMLRPNATSSEAYRSLRTSIQLASLEKQVTSIMITSSGPAEGKSTTMSNLAVTLAQAGRRTLIVDCDMRRPVVNQIFNINREPGLAEVLTDKLDWHEHIQPTAVEGLFVLPSGKIPSNPSELVGRQHMADILAEMKQEYDFVLCDVPPILVVSDAALLASHLDGVLILVRSGLAIAHDVARAAEQMERVGGKVIGAVFNAMDTESNRYGKYGYGKYGYGKYGYGKYGYGKYGYGKYGYGAEDHEASDAWRTPAWEIWLTKLNAAGTQLLNRIKKKGNKRITRSP